MLLLNQKTKKRTAAPAVDSPTTTLTRIAGVNGTRNLQLDVLRCIAVLLVLINHAYHKELTGAPLFDALRHGSWMGVDLFFVLSGFLVSGLLFEQVRKGKLPDVTNFLIRRGFKIYPSYFIMLMVGWILISPSVAEGIKRFAPLFFFSQNYSPSFQLFGHTWSLAVEEHFYAILALAFFCIRRGVLSVATLKNLCIATVVCVPLLRAAAYMSAPGHHIEIGQHFATHFRIDSLALGVVFCYYWQYHNSELRSFAQSHRPLILISGICLLSPAFFAYRESGAFFIFGYSAVAVGSALVILSALSIKSQLSWLKPVAFLGKHSFSIYLWHALVLMFVQITVIVAPNALNCPVEIALSIGGPIIFGVLASMAIDMPMLKLSDCMSAHRKAQSLKKQQAARKKVALRPARSGSQA